MRATLDRLKDKNREDGGFTLIELLVVIVIIGILAGVVVFAVNGISDRGEDSACEADEQTLTVAQEANFARDGSYVNEAELVTNGFITAQSDLWNTVATSGGADYDLTPAAGSGC